MIRKDEFAPGAKTLAAVGSSVALLVFSASIEARAVTPESPEVRQLIDRGIEYLSSASDERLGGICLIGLAFVKDDQPDHPKVQEAVAACRAAKNRQDVSDVYSNGIALIFLCELDASRHRDLVEFFLGGLQRRQKGHGGWGYDAAATGDTSQTQYGTLGIWEAHRNGFSVGSQSAAQCIDWVIRTQDPSGAWGYQGKVTTTEQRVRQSEIRHSMVAAGMSSLLVCADVFGLLRAGAAEADSGSRSPVGFRQAEAEPQDRRVRPLKADGIDRARLFTALRDGRSWMDENFKVGVPLWDLYYLYSIERFESFAELLLDDVPTEPTWYREGFDFLAKAQAADGSWSDRCGRSVSTAFGVLFLLRSTQKSLRRSLGDGVMLSGRGAPVALARKIGVNPGGKLVQATSTKLADMLSALGDGEADALDALAADPNAFVGQEVDDQTARRLQQIVRGGQPTARLLAVRSLGRAGDLDYVPTLLYALTDPDRRVALAARDGLRFVSRRFTGFGLPDDFTDRQRYEALDKWKSWYLTLRPDAVIDL